MKKYINIIGAIVVIAAIVALLFFVWQNFQKNNSVTPGITIPGDWKIFTDSQRHISFRYPETISTNYIHTVDWPPSVQILNQAFQCTEAGSEIKSAGETKKVTIGGTTYCVTKESQGAAGSIYTMYEYAFEKNGKTIVLAFTLRFVQCANYPEPENTTCQKERDNFSMDGIMHLVAQSFKTL